MILTFLHSDRYYYGCKEIAVKICRLTVAIGKNHVEITAFNNINKSGIKESPAISTVHAFIKDHNAMKHTRLMALCPGLPGWARTRKVKPIWILLKQEIVSGSGISWAMCKSAPRSRQITMPAPHHSVFYRPDALPAAQPTASTHWRQCHENEKKLSNCKKMMISRVKF